MLSEQYSSASMHAFLSSVVKDPEFSQHVIKKSTIGGQFYRVGIRYPAGRALPSAKHKKGSQFRGKKQKLAVDRKLHQSIAAWNFDDVQGLE